MVEAISEVINSSLTDNFGMIFIYYLILFNMNEIKRSSQIARL